MRVIAQKLKISYGVVNKALRSKDAGRSTLTKPRKNVRKKPKRLNLSHDKVNLCDAYEKGANKGLFHVHHVLPMAAGGVDDLTNIANI